MNTKSTKSASVVARMKSDRAAKRQAQARQAKVDRAVTTISVVGSAALDAAGTVAYGASVRDMRSRSYGLSRLVETPQQRNAADAVELALGMVELGQAVVDFIDTAAKSRQERKAAKKAKKAQKAAEASYAESLVDEDILDGEVEDLDAMIAQVDALMVRIENIKAAEARQS